MTGAVLAKLNYTLGQNHNQNRALVFIRLNAWFRLSAAITRRGQTNNLDRQRR